jgi:hypothetical protein
MRNEEFGMKNFQPVVVAEGQRGRGAEGQRGKVADATSVILGEAVRRPSRRIPTLLRRVFRILAAIPGVEGRNESDH